MSQQQGNRTWVLTAVLVILGLTAGLGLGLVIGWVILPVEYVDTAIADLGIEAKEEYILLVASAYTSGWQTWRAATLPRGATRRTSKPWRRWLTDWALPARR